MKSLLTAMWQFVVDVFVGGKVAVRKIRGFFSRNGEEKKDREIFKHDIIVGPILWHAIMVVLSGGVSYAISVILSVAGAWGFAQGYLVQNPFLGTYGTVVWLALFALFLLPKWKKEPVGEGDNQKMKWKLDVFSVPAPARGAQLTWAGMVTPLILESGDYIYLRFGFAWLEVGSETIADKGFLILGDVTFKVWQSHEEATTSITLQAGNGATVTGNFSLVLEGKRRIRWEEAGDAGLQVGNRARQELQETIENFVDTDVKSLQKDVPELIKGRIMKTVFLPKSLEGFKKRSILRDRNGLPMYFIEGGTETEEKFRERILKEGDEKSVEIIPRDSEGKILLAKVKVTEPITKLIKELGFEIKDVVYDSVRASEPVEQASNQASAQDRQREVQIESARATAAARKELMPKEGEVLDQHYEFRTALSAAQDPDNNGQVKVVYLAGANETTRSLTAADIINSGDKQ